MILRRRLSLSQRLLVGLLVVSFAYWAVIALITIRDSVDDVYELFDAHLAQTALALLRVTDPDDEDQLALPDEAEAPGLREIFAQLSHLPERLAAANSPNGGSTYGPSARSITGRESIHSLHVEYEKLLRYQIWDGKGNLLLRSANAPAAAMTAADGFSETTDSEGRLWRHYGVWDRHGHFRILVAEAHDVRNRLVRNIAMHLVSPLVFGLPVLIFLLWFSVSRGLDPLGALKREIESRKPESLTPLDAESAPGEVRPMVQALNDLLRRMANTLENERRFTSNAAHELRTPLAALQAHLHAATGAQSEAERSRAMRQLQLGVERGRRLVGQLLNLARLDPEQAMPDVEDVNLGELAQAVCAELAPLTLQRDQTLELYVELDLPPLPGNADMLSMLLANLVDNAIRYTPQGGHIEVAVRRDGSGVLLEVGDDGPGIPEAERELVLERFYRIAGQHQPGTGLGLAICRRIAELHDHARITLVTGRGDRGLAAGVLFQVRQPT